MPNGDEFERLILALQSTDEQPPPPAEGSAAPRLEQWLRLVAERGGSDLLLVAGAPPAIRIDGRVLRLDAGPLDGDDIEEAVLPVLLPHAKEQYRDRPVSPTPRSASRVSRAFASTCTTSADERPPPCACCPYASLASPASGSRPVSNRLRRSSAGSRSLGGATGSGKTTTLAAIVDEINRRDPRHIVTIEDPVEYEHVHKKSVIEQVEIGVDAPDFPTALRAALRQAPDVIVIGEMRDPETMRIALAAAETGHLVLSTLHTTDVASTVSRIADSFPVERQNTIRQELAMALAALATQMLLPRTGGGLVPAAELLMVGYGARQHIRKNALQHLHQEITITRKHGSLTLEESLAGLVRQGLVDWRDAHGRAAHTEEFEQLSPRIGA